MPPRITPTFHLLKSRILSSLSSPPSTYTDASPKGSIDAGIRDLIDRINILEGVVTTSSCAGRVSVFLEGAKAVDRGEGEGEETWDDEEGGGVEAEKEGQVAVPGGKGRGGRWLFVSHEAVEVPATKQKDHFGQLFGLRGGDTTEGVAAPCANPSTTRFVRFQFEPFVRYLLPLSTALQVPALPSLSRFLFIQNQRRDPDPPFSAISHVLASFLHLLLNYRKPQLLSKSLTPLNPPRSSTSPPPPSITRNPSSPPPSPPASANPVSNRSRTSTTPPPSPCSRCAPPV